MITAWRITKAKHKNIAFTGFGCQFTSGRWHNQKVTVVYCSESQALSALEIFVHIGEDGKDIKFVSFEINIPSSLILDVSDISELPKRWRKEPPGAGTKKIGSDWVNSSASPVLSIPSAVIPKERNYLLNTHHSDFSSISIQKPEPFSFDSRMW